MPEPEHKLLPPPTKGHTSVARVADDWYVVCRSKELGRRPRPITLLGIPMVVYRAEDGTAAALLDRCPHRNVPLSMGRVRGPYLECGYHGWQFDAQGSCRAIPGLCGIVEGKGRRVAAFACREQQGFVWVYASPDAVPEREPHAFPYLGKTGYSSVVQTLNAPGTLHATAENALDVPHTAFLHRGLFRKDTTKRNEIQVVVKRWHDRVEAEYIGEPRPPGLFGRILAPGGGVVRHWDRFLLPSILEVEYQLGDTSHLIAAAALTPVSDFETQLNAVISFRLPIPHWLIAPFLKPIGLRIFRQDARVLALQTSNIERFGGEQYVSTDIDVLGNHILRLLRNAERGDRRERDEPDEKRLEMAV